MRRRTLLPLFAAFAGLAVLFLLPAGAVGAESGEDIAGEFSKVARGIADEAPGLIPESFTSGDAGAIGDGIAEAGSFTSVVTFLWRALGLALPTALPTFASLLGILLVAAAAKKCDGLLASSGLSDAVSFCAAAAITLSVLGLEGEALSSVLAFFERLRFLSDGLIAPMAALYAMGGALRTAVVSNAGTATFLLLLENVCAPSLRAVVGLCAGLTVASAFAPGVNLTGMGNLIRKIYIFLLGFIMLLLTFTLSLQTTLSASADNVAARSAKLLAGSAIPIVGGAVGDTLRTLSGSLAFLRGVVGYGGILLLGALLVPVFLSVLLRRLMFMAAGACADLLGLERESRLIGGFVTVWGFLLAAVSVVSVAFVLLMTLFVHCGVGG